MLQHLAPRRDNHECILADRPYTSSSSEKRKSTGSHSLLVPVVPSTNTRSSVRSSMVIGRVTYGEKEPHLTTTPWELERHEKRSGWRRSKTAEHRFPTATFKNLPKEVYESIVAQLEQIHLRQREACSSCYLKDLHSLSLVSRAWDKATTPRMYCNVLLTADEDHARLPKLKIKGTSRLKLLRRTLRNQPTLARCVRELHLSGLQTLYQEAVGVKEDIVSLVASLVMACPRLERLVGFHIPYAQSFDRLSYALSTRRYLKEKTWLLFEQRSKISDEEDNGLRTCYLAAYDPTERFLDLNSNHKTLSTLVLHQRNHQKSSTLNFRAMIGTFRALPALRHLSISGLPSFTNMALNALPPHLESLRLERLPSINDKGLQRFATSQLAASIQKLLLIELDISSLVTISNIFSTQFTSLIQFTLAQTRAPGFSPQACDSEFLSPTLQYIHFEFRSEAGPLPVLLPFSSDVSEPPSFPFTSREPTTCLATSLLAEGIRMGRFPSLRRVRIPHDPQGFIQALCIPLQTTLLPSDMTMLRTSPGMFNLSGSSTISNHEPPQFKARNSAISARWSKRADSAIDTTPCDFPKDILIPARSRLAAQSRILASRKNAFMTVRVYDPSGNLRINRDVPGFIGQVGSQITYDLRADRGRTLRGSIDFAEGRNQWITNIEDVVGDDGMDFEELHHKSWGSCGHRLRRRVGRDLMTVDDLF